MGLAENGADQTSAGYQEPAATEQGGSGQIWRHVLRPQEGVVHYGVDDQALFCNFVEWLKYNDLQVMANTPLVVRQLVQYAVNMKGKKERPAYLKLVKKCLTLKVLQDVVKLMKTPHEVIQYNSCLLMSAIVEMDNEMNATCKAMGAVEILEAFKRVHEQRQQQAQINQMAQQMGMAPALPFNY